MTLPLVTLEIRDFSETGTICLPLKKIDLLVYGVMHKEKLPLLFFLIRFFCGFFCRFLYRRFRLLFFFSLRIFIVFLFFEGGF